MYHYVQCWTYLESFALDSGHLWLRYGIRASKLTSESSSHMIRQHRLLFASGVNMYQMSLWPQICRLFQKFPRWPSLLHIRTRRGHMRDLSGPPLNVVHKLFQPCKTTTVLTSKQPTVVWITVTQKHHKNPNGLMTLPLTQKQWPLLGQSLNPVGLIGPRQWPLHTGSRNMTRIHVLFGINLLCDVNGLLIGRSRLP